MNKILIFIILMVSSCGQYVNIKTIPEPGQEIIGSKTDAVLSNLDSYFPTLTYSPSGESANKVKIEAESGEVLWVSNHLSGAPVSSTELNLFENYTLSLISLNAKGEERVTYTKNFRLEVDDDFNTLTLKNFWDVVDRDNYVQAPADNLAAYNAGQLILKGRGSDMWNNTHEFVGLYLNDLKNDFDVYVKLSGLNHTDGSQKAGFTIANNIEDFSESGVVSCLQTYDFDLQLVFSSGDTDNLDTPIYSGNTNLPKYIRMKKVGNEISCYYKELESEAWTLMNGTPIIRNFDASFDLSIMGFSHNTGQTGIFTFDEFKEVQP